MNIFEKMAAITAELNAVAKNLKVGEGRSSYKAVGEADVLAAVKPLEEKHNVYSYPCARRIVESDVITTKKVYNGQESESSKFFMRLETVYRFVNTEKPEEFVDITTYGDGMDAGDKAPGNLVYRAYRDAVQEQDPQKRVQARKRMARTVGSVVFSMFLNAVAQSLWDAVRDDDDRDEKYWERFLKHIGPNFAQNVNPLGMVPYFRDVLSILQGYDVERMDLAAVTSFFSALQNMGKAINGEGRYTVPGAGANLLAELSRMVGLPVATVKRDLLAVARTIGVETENWRFQYQLERALNSVVYAGNRKEFYDIAFGALKDGDTELYQEIAEDLMKQDVKASTIESAMRQRLKDAKAEDPDFSMPQKSADLIGSFTAYAPQEDKEERFSANDLDAGTYQKYAAQSAGQAREWTDALEGYKKFDALDGETKDKALKSARDLAEDMALLDWSDGRFTEADLSTWERWATKGGDYGVDETEAILFRMAYDMAESEKNDDGKTISGSKMENTVDLVEDWMPWLSDRELEYLMSAFWTPEDKALKEMKENKFMS